jgi:hypothetical protein
VYLERTAQDITDMKQPNRAAATTLLHLSFYVKIEHGNTIHFSQKRLKDSHETKLYSISLQNTLASSKHVSYLASTANSGLGR